MSKFCIRLKELRNSRGLSQQSLSELIGISKSSINMYERGEREPGLDKLEHIADFFNIDLNYLLGQSEEPNRLLSSVHKIPVLGTVRAGIPWEAVENILDYEEISPHMASTGEYFGLRVKGDSMEPKISDGDVIIIKKQSDADTGDIVVALVNGDEATVKKLKKTEQGIILIPSNQIYEPLFFSFADIEKMPVDIIGRVVELRAKF